MLLFVLIWKFIIPIASAYDVSIYYDFTATGIIYERAVLLTKNLIDISTEFETSII